MKPTARHRPPATASGPETRPAFVCCFPVATVLPVPSDGGPVGREWLLAAGIEDHEVSGRHVRFERRAGSMHLQDVGSSNGTWLDGAPLQPHEEAVVAEGAVVRLGRTLLVYREAFAGSPTADPPLGELVGPFGLRGVRAALKAIGRQRPANVLIQGETGTGKELVSHEVARAVGRGERLVAVNVAGVAAGVFEAQLFGRLAGAYSDARTSAKGVFAQHDGGAVLLDEIGELPLELQPKLLRLLENREVLPVGAAQPTRVDVVVLAATNRDLEQMVQEGRFRRDLYARLAVARVELPALRDRPEDIFSIATALSRRAGLPIDADATEVEAVERLVLHGWDGNARDLANALRQLNALEPSGALKLWAVDRVLGHPPAGPTSASLSQQLVAAALEASGGREAEAARRLGVSRGKLRRFLGKA